MENTDKPIEEVLTLEMPVDEKITEQVVEENLIIEEHSVIQEEIKEEEKSVVEEIKLSDDDNNLLSDNKVDVEIEPDVKGNNVTLQICSCPFNLMFSCFSRKNKE